MHGTLASLSALLLASCGGRVEQISGGLRFPDGLCTVGDTLLVSNSGAVLPSRSAPGDKGYIAQIVDGVVSPYYEADGTLSAPKGMAVSGDYLYVADLGRVHIIRRSTKDKEVIWLPTGEASVSDVEVVGDMLIVSVTGTGHLFALDLAQDGSPAGDEFQPLVSIPGASGLCYTDGRLFVATYCPEGVPPLDENVIYVIDDFVRMEPRRFVERAGQYEGLAAGDGCLYFTDWVGTPPLGRVSLSGAGEVEMIDIELEVPVESPTCVAVMDGAVYVVDMYADRVLRIKN